MRREQEIFNTIIQHNNIYLYSNLININYKF